MADRFYRVALGLSPSRVKRLWIALVFSGVDVTPPRLLKVSQNVIETVANDRNAIAFVPFSEVDRGVKTLRVDGFLPGDPRYPIR